MARPRNIDYNFKEKMALIKQAGMHPQEIEDKAITDSETPGKEVLEYASLPERIKELLKIIQSSPVKATEMLSLIMYDIENDKVRTLLAKYLIEKGCVRIQKSVYMLRAERKLYLEVSETLKEVQESYDNNDSIILVPIPANTPGSMQIIGKDIQIDTLVKKPNMLYF